MITYISTNGTQTTLPATWAQVRGLLPKTIEVVQVGNLVLLADGESILKSMLLNIEATELSGTPIFGPALLLSNEEYVRITAKGLN